MAPRNRPHILIQQRAQTEQFKPPKRKIEKQSQSIPEDRRALGERLTFELGTANQYALERRNQCTVETQERCEGIYVTFQSFPGLELALESLDPTAGKKHPELLSVQRIEIDGELVEKATVYIPDGKLGYFLSRLQGYIETADETNPKHLNLVDRIRSIGLASLKELWTDPPEEFPQDDGLIWWEIWLRRQGGLELETLTAFANAVGARMGHRSLGFNTRTVTLVEARPTQLTQALDVLDGLAELRRPRQTATMLAGELASDQAEWVNELAERTTVAGGEAPAVCIIDTGVHQPHPLLAASLFTTDCHACNPSWGTGDHHSHGTEMAGLALYGDIGASIVDRGPVYLRHRLESVKILPPSTHQANTPENYGALTATAASQVEISAPLRQRVFSMAVTAPSVSLPTSGSTEIFFGQPSSWSAAVDALSSGLSIDVTESSITFLDADDDIRRLFLISAGNVDTFEVDHLVRSDLSPVEDPTQAWNALTVGAYTALDTVEEPDFDGWSPVAQQGELSPFSRTSVAFSRVWPIKPDVVLEGGNIAVSPKGENFDTPDSLQILTTNAPLSNTRLLTLTNATSAATSQAAHLGASILAEYPSLWPETVRALIIHSAEWTTTMQRHFQATNRKEQRTVLQRRYGMGVPDLNRALRSGSDALTLIVQDTISPFDIDGKMREMHLHDLPWPSDVLADLGAVDVRLRVTLSYFIEPNPGARGWVRRYSYASHGLRFDLRRRTESTDDFRKRINAKALGEDEHKPSTEADSDQWFFGAKGREKGSLHTDIWIGPAIDLAMRGAVAVFPVSGWWKNNKVKENNRRLARYSLIVSIETPGQDVDIWTPVAQAVGIPIEVEV